MPVYLTATLPALDCEHCDGDNHYQGDQQPGATRLDPLRGRVCQTCDEILDQMEADEPGEIGGS